LLSRNYLCQLKRIGIGYPLHDNFNSLLFRNVQGDQNIYTSPEKQSLAEAAAEIQKLLKQLEQTNPTATDVEKQAFVSKFIPLTLRQLAVSALQSGGKAAIEEFLDNPYVNVAIAIIEGWRSAESEA
jgi:hypothetical protein